MLISETLIMVRQQQREDDSFDLFDPINQWLVDLDIACPTTDLDFLKDSSFDFDSTNFELGQQDQILEAFLDQKMEKVNLVDSKMYPNDADCGKIEVFEASVEVGNHHTTSNGVVGEEKNDPKIAANESNEKESSGESEESGVSSSSDSSSSSFSSSDEEEESSSSKEEEEDADEVDILSSDGEEEVTKRPIRLKHEIEDHPPVPPLEVSLEPHHQTLPVGVVSSILGNRVIVEGSEKHNPLNEGSILWITETRLPLGRIDEIFGPVKNPYYIVRYNSDKEVPQGINIGVAISFVVDFANHVLNEKYLYEKGYDASDVDDEEVDGGVEFSDDEKEAEYKRSLRQKKRDKKHGGNQESEFGKKKSNFKGSGFHKGKQLQSPHALPNQQGHHAPGAPVHLGCNNFNSAAHGAPSFGTSVASSPAIVQAFPSRQSNAFPAQGFHPQPLPMNLQGGFPPQPQPLGIQSGFPPQPQIMAMQGGLPLNWMSAQHQNQFFNNFVSGMMQHQQQQYLLPNAGTLTGNIPWFCGPSNPSVDMSSALFGLMAQRGFPQTPLRCSNVNPNGCEQTSTIVNQSEFSKVKCGNVNLQGSLAVSNSEQNHGQASAFANQGGFGQVPYGCSNVNSQGSLAVSNNDQGHGQTTPVVNEGRLGQVPFGCGNANPNGQASEIVYNQSEMRHPSMQFNQGMPSSSSNRGRRPYGRGGGRHSLGRQGGSQHNG